MRRHHVSKRSGLLGALALLVFMAASGPLSAAPIDLNTATQSDLMSLKGIGEVRARSIIADREKNGPFRSVDDLRRVKGIGKKTVERLRSLVTVGAAAEEAPASDMDQGAPGQVRPDASRRPDEGAQEIQFPKDESTGPDDVEVL